MKPRRWFSFSLRTLFILLTLFGIWLGLQVKWVHDRRTARQWIAEHQPPPEPAPSGGLSGPRYTWFELKPFPWVLEILGEKPVFSITVVAGPDDSDQIERLRKLFPEASLHPVKPRANQP